MKKPTLFALSALLLCFASSCQKPERDASARPEEDAKADIASIKALLVEWVNLYNAEDFEKLISIFYKKNAILMPPNAPARRTQEEILLSYRKDSESNIQQVDDSVAEDVRICGDLAFAWGQDTGTTTPRGRGEPVKYSVKWLMVFERQSDGAWKCLYEIWNDNGP